MEHSEDTRLNEALELHKSGRIRAAETKYEEILEAKGNSFQKQDADVFYLLGTVKHQIGMNKQAIKLLKISIELEPNNFLTYNSIGSAYKAAGELDNAKKSFQKAIDIKPEYPETYYNLANVYKTLNLFEDAIANYQKAISIKNDYAKAYNNLGNVLKESNRFDEAIKAYQSAINSLPNYAEAYNNLGSAFTAQGFFEEALNAYKKALELNESYAEANFNLANLFCKMEAKDEAITNYKSAISKKPQLIDAYINLGNLLKNLKRYPMAKEVYKKGITLAPMNANLYKNLALLHSDMKEWDKSKNYFDKALSIDSTDSSTYSSLGYILYKKNEYDEALAAFNKALDLDPDNDNAYQNLGVVLVGSGDIEKGISSFDKAMEINPENREAPFSKSLSYLMTGNFEDGWRLYESRFEQDDMKPNYPKFIGKQLWRGEDITGKKLLVHTEQGAGDTIMFCRYLLLLEEKGIDVLFIVPEVLRDIVSSLGCKAEFKTEGQIINENEFDVYCPLMSLPYILKTRLDSIPNYEKYLFPETQKIKSWKKQLGNSKEIRVGIAWSGSTLHLNDENRSMTLERLQPLLSQNLVEWHSLQVEYSKRDQALLNSLNIIQHQDELKSYADTAALIENMDLIITVDTGVAHLSGALGKPTWLMLAFAPDFRWLLERKDSPWYPTVRLFRQPTPGEWGILVDEVKSELLDHLKKVECTPLLK